MNPNASGAMKRVPIILNGLPARPMHAAPRCASADARSDKQNKGGRKMRLRVFRDDEASLIRAVIEKVRACPPEWKDMDIGDDGTCVLVALAAWLNAIELHEAAVEEFEKQVAASEAAARGRLDS